MAMRKENFEDYKNTIRMLFRLFLLSKRMDFVYEQILLFLEPSSVSSYVLWKPVFFLSPNEDHQTKNIKAIVDKKGALLLKRSELESEFSLVLKRY
jgi:UDP-N-acetylglucosamine--N-acetylmuramyl-(pentapeptide) pyrophosphoryl-undecaprenol N-acetylglucosamine transferase